MTPKRILSVLVGALLMLAPMAATSAADPQPLAYEQNFATDVDWTDTAKDCFPEGLGVKGCVQGYGDVLWVLDRWSDGHGVSLSWWEYNGSTGNATGRYGKCIDNLGSAVGWTACDKDFTEGNVIEWTVQYWDNGQWQHRGPWYTVV